MHKTITQKLILLIALVSFSFLTKAQDCEAYYPMSEGSVFELTSYDGKGKETGKSRNSIIEKKVNGDEMEAVVKVEHFDKKGKESFTSEYSMYCKNGQFSLDTRSMMGPENMGTMENVEVNVDASELTFPADPTPGTTLDDAHLKVSMQTSGFSMGGMQINITNRKIGARESITTPAGTFDCVLMTQTVESKTMGIKILMSSKTWYSTGAGAVKSETYNKKGKLMSTEILTLLEK